MTVIVKGSEGFLKNQDITMMRRAILILLLVFLLSQTAFFVLRYFLTGIPYAIATRLNVVAVQQFVMICGSVFIWWNLAPAINGILDDFPLQPSCNDWLTVGVQNVLRAFIILLLFLTHTCSIFYYLWIGEEPNIFAMIALTSVAVYIYLIFFLIIFLFMQTVFRFILRVDSKHFKVLRLLVANELSIRFFAIVLGVVLALGGLWVALLPPVVRHVTIKIENLPKAQEGFTIALLSDLHVGPTVGHSKIQRMVDIINPFKPDVIAISGDLADGTVHHLGRAVYPLSNLISKYGVYFATGNHEYLHGNVDEWFVFLKKINIIPLHNENKKILVGDSRICIAGADDLFAKYSRLPGHAMDYKKALRGCNKNDTTIMLIHQPNAVRVILNDIETAKNVDLIMSGHTHAGQMYVFVPFVYFWNAYFRGLYYDTVTRTHIYVSAGVNYFGPPVKVFDGSEIILIKPGIGEIRFKKRLIACEMVKRKNFIIMRNQRINIYICIRNEHKILESMS
ncbi:putative metallophosphoesterase F40B5.2 [Dirofilaria immitis]